MQYNTVQLTLLRWKFLLNLIRSCSFSEHMTILRTIDLHIFQSKNLNSIVLLHLTFGQNFQSFWFFSFFEQQLRTEEKPREKTSKRPEEKPKKTKKTRKKQRKLKEKSRKNQRIGRSIFSWFLFARDFKQITLYLLKKDAQRTAFKSFFWSNDWRQQNN